MLAANNQPKSITSPELVLKLQRPGKNKIVIWRSVAKRAVDRNRIKRIVRVAIGQIESMKRGYTVIIRKNIAGLKTQAVLEIISKLLKKSSHGQKNS